MLQNFGEDKEKWWSERKLDWERRKVAKFWRG